MTIIEAIRRLTPAQRRALDMCGMDRGGDVHPSMLRKLESRGLVVGQSVTEGAFTWTQYHMPIAVHIAWCSVGAAEFDALSPEEQAAMEAPDNE